MATPPSPSSPCSHSIPQLIVVKHVPLTSICLRNAWTSVAQSVEDDNGDVLVLKNSIKSAMAKHQYEAFSRLTTAAKAGDVDTISELIRAGADLDAVDYDGRSALAMVDPHSACLRLGRAVSSCSIF